MAIVLGQQCGRVALVVGIGGNAIIICSPGQ